MTASSKILKSLRKELKMKKCKYCKSIENLTLDHKIPKILGGKNEIGNMQCLCKRCNGIKSGIPHKRVLALFQWFLAIQKDRVERGKNPYTLK